MIENEIEIQLSAYADGELPAAERALLEARLAAEPALARLLNGYRMLQSAARAEAMPQVLEKETRAWPMVAARAFSFPDEVVQKLDAAAWEETCPVLSGERARTAWKGIVGRALHSFPADVFHNAPKVSEKDWSNAWKKISTRAKIVQLDEVKAEATRAGSPRPQMPAGSRRSQEGRSRGKVISIWGWAAGVGLAAAAMLAIVFSTPPAPADPETSGTSMAMAIPESEDDRYGVLVKYMPGSDDPVIVLYEKNSDANQ